MEEDILHIELLNRPVMGDSSGEHHAHSGRFHNRAESLIVVDSGALSETPKDLASLVVIEGPVSAELVCEDPFANDDVGALRSWNKVPYPITHQGPVLILHSLAPIWIGEGSANEGRDLNLMIIWMEINLGKDFSTGKLIKENVDAGQRIFVLDGDGIQRSVVNT
jgi:hypothetical protein